MFSKNEYVVYGSTGVCKIIDIVTKKIGNTKERLYYLLKPEYETNSIIYAPIDNNSVVMRKIITKDEIYELIKKMPESTDIWIDDINLRKLKYLEILKNGNKKDIAALIRTLYLQKQERKKEGKKLNINDEKIMNEAEKLLNQEFALVLNIDQSEVVPFILEKINFYENNNL